MFGILKGEWMGWEKKRQKDNLGDCVNMEVFHWN